MGDWTLVSCIAILFILALMQEHASRKRSQHIAAVANILQAHLQIHAKEDKKVNEKR